MAYCADSKASLIENLANHTWCRLAVSKIVPENVGVVALRDIPQGVDPFAKPESVEEPGVVHMTESDMNLLHPNVKKYAEDFFEYDENGLAMSRAGLNALDISYYLNHSFQPNLDVVHEGEWIAFRTNRIVAEGEELTYTYASPPLDMLFTQEFFVNEHGRGTKGSSADVRRIMQCVKYATFETTLRDDRVWKCIWKAYCTQPLSRTDANRVLGSPWYDECGNALKTTDKMLSDVYECRNLAFVVRVDQDDMILFRSELLGTRALLSLLAHEMQHVIDSHFMPYEIFRSELRAWIVEKSCEERKPIAEILSSHQALYSIVQRIANEYMCIRSRKKIAELYRQARAWHPAENG